MKILIIYKLDCHPARSLAKDLQNELKSSNISSSILSNTNLSAATISQYDMVFVLGGDGTILRTARYMAGTGIPLLSVNFGRIGFLSNTEPETMTKVLQKIPKNEYSIEEKLMLEVYMKRGLIQEYMGLALNDAVIRSHVIHPININIQVDSEQFVYTGDGIICATPTGSTAYSYSAGGPIIETRAQALVITPINPQLPCCRSTVLDVNTILSFEIVSEHSTIMSIDGQSEIELQPGDNITVRKSDYTVNFVQFEHISGIRKMLRCLNKSLFDCRKFL